MLFPKPTREQVIALAGVFHACQLVETLAKTGICPSRDFETSIHSLFEQNPDSTLAVFGNLDALAPGMDAMNRALSATKDAANKDILRYVLGVLYLHKKLAGNRAKLNQVGEGIGKAARQAEHFSKTHSNVLANLADLYVNTIGTFNFRIQVSGAPQYLQQPDVANRIRCLLFAAIRAAMLWQQVGGKRYHLILQRQRVLDIVHDMKRLTSDA